MLLWLALFCICLSVFFITLLLMHLSANGLSSHRDQMRFFPILLPLSPMIGWFGRMLYPGMTWSHRDKIQTTLHRSGYFGVQVELFFATQVTCGTILALLLSAAFAFGQLGWGGPWLFVTCVAWVVGFLIPTKRLQSQLKGHRDNINQQWPYFMDLLVICLCAGMGFDSALRMTVDSLSSGAVKLEWERYFSDLRTGLSKQDALKALADRVELKPVIHFVSSLSFSEKCGSSLVKHLQQQSLQLRTEQAIMAEEHALQAPIKMLLPLSVCFFPCTFLVISYPIVKQLLGTF